MMKITKSAWMFFTFSLLLCWVPATLAQAESTRSLSVEGQTRSYILHEGASLDTESSSALLIALHDSASSAQALQAISDLNEQADRYNFRVAYPQSANIFWDDGRFSTGAFGQLNTEADDMAFLMALIDEMIATESADPQQIYLTGLGNGATMAFRLACESPERFAGLVAVNALLYRYQERDCPPQASASLDILSISGTENERFPFDGRSSETNSAEDLLNLNDTLAFWANRNACNLEESERGRESLYIVFSTCADATETGFILIPEASGDWPRVGDYRLNQYGIDASDIIGAFVSADADWREFAVISSPVPGLARNWGLYVPSSYDGGPMPLLLMLHGSPGSPASTAYVTDMNRIAEREQFIVAYPQGLGQTWNALRDISIFQGSGPQDDSAFLADLIADLGQDLNIDQSRIYAVGFSGGGLMSQRLACEDPDQYAAIATVAASAFFGLQRLCENSSRVPYLYMQGTQDPNFPWLGVPIPELGDNQFVFAPPISTLSFWVTHNGCLTSFEQEDLPPASEASSVSIFRYPGCSADVIFYGILNGGHNWPGVPGRIAPGLAGIVNTDINAGEVIWDFFSQHTR